MANNPTKIIIITFSKDRFITAIKCFCYFQILNIELVKNIIS